MFYFNYELKQTNKKEFCIAYCTNTILWVNSTTEKKQHMVYDLVATDWNRLVKAVTSAVNIVENNSIVSCSSLLP